MLNGLELYIPPVYELGSLSEFYKIFADPTRLKILFVLLKQKMCVMHIAEYVNMSPSAVSHQLATLRRANIVKNVKLGKTTVYSIADEHIEKLLDMALIHIREK